MTSTVDLPASMRAIEVRELIGPDGLRRVDRDLPWREDRILLEVHEAGVSFPDLLLSQGRYQRKPDVPFIPGVEAAGIIRFAPADTGFTEGQRIAAFVGLGAWADYVGVDPTRAFPLPDDMSFRAAAGLPMNYLTAHLALAHRGQVQPGETVLVHGAAGGLGTALVQVARALHARVIAVVSSPEKARIAEQAGADHVVESSDWTTAVRGLTDGFGVDVVADTVGSDRTIDSLRLLRIDGRLLVLGFAGGQIPEIPANRLLLRNISAVGVAWGPYVDARPEFPAQQWSQMLSMIDAGHIAPIAGPRHELDNAAHALRDLADRSAIGKVTLQVRP